MDAINKQFMDNPMGFMGKNVMRTHRSMDPPVPGMPRELSGGAGVAAGKVNLDLNYDSDDKAIIVVSLYKGVIDKKACPIMAWWLPWKSGTTSSLKLGSGADFFFTSSLGGCRIEFSGGTEPVVSHIAGDTGGLDKDGSGPGGSAWRDQESKQNAGAHQGMVRRLSATDETSPTLYGQTGAGMFAGYKKGAWKFIMQAQNMQGGRRVIVKVSEMVG
jgi:hypothetical protein